MPLAKRTLATLVWALITAGVYGIAFVLPNGLMRQVVMIIAISWSLTFLALFFLLMAQILAPLDPAKV